MNPEGSTSEKWIGNFIKRECDFVKNTTKGSSTQENNAALACRINLYRMRTDMLENRYLSSAKQ